MDVKRYYSGWDQAQRPAVFSIQVTDNTPLTYTATIDTGKFYADLDDGTYGSFCAALTQALDLAANGAGSAITWAVTWENATPQYRIAPSAGTFTGVLNAEAQTTLGMSAAIGPSASETSTVVPYFVNVPAIDGISESSGDYRDGEGIVSASVTDGGRQYGVGATTQAVRHDWIQPFEQLSTTYNYAASGAAPYTFERLFVHVGAWFPIVTVNTAATWAAGAPVAAYATHAIARFKLTRSGALYGPIRVVPDLDNFWHIPFDALIEERLR